MRSSDPSRPARLHALIPCAGTGSRAGTALPKQYQAVAGRPLVQHTLAAFAAVARIDSVLVAVAPGDTTLAQEPGVEVVPCGAATRAATVAGGLQALRDRGAGEQDWVLVHDAARCLVTPALIDSLIDACQDDEVGGLLALPLADTLKHGSDGRVLSTVPREGHWLAQTPQMFRLGLLERALRAAGPAATDEASAVETLGLSPRLVTGAARNFKVTWPDDFLLAEAILSRTSP